MKDFYSAQASPPPQNKGGVKLEQYDVGKGLREKAVNQSNLLRIQFYNNIDFPKKDEIVKQIRNRSKRILSFSMVGEDSTTNQDKQEGQQHLEKQFYNQEVDQYPYSIQHLKNSKLIDKSLTENPRSKMPHKSKPQKNNQIQINQQYKNKLGNNLSKNQSSSLDLFSNIEDDLQVKKKFSIQQENQEALLIKKRSSVLLPKFDSIGISPFEYKGISQLNTSLIQQYNPKRKEKAVVRNDISKLGNIYIHNTDFNSQKLPSLKDSFADVVQNHVNRNQFNSNIRYLSPQKYASEQMQSNNSYIQNEQQELLLSGRNSIKNAKVANTQNDVDQHQQNKISNSDRKLAVIKILRSKRKTRQQSLPSADMVVSNSIQAQSLQYQNEQALIKSLNKSIEPNAHIQQKYNSNNVQRLSLDSVNKDNNKSGRNNQINNVSDKNSLSRLLMQQQPLKLQEVKMQNQIVYEQVPPTPIKSAYLTPNSPKKRVHSQQSRSNLQHSLEQISVNQSLVIKKSSLDSQYIYPIMLQESNQISQQNSPSKRLNLTPQLIYKNQKLKEDDIYKNCQQYITRLFKKRDYSLRKRSPIKIQNTDSPKSQLDCYNNPYKNKKKEGYFVSVHLMEKSQEEKLNQDYEQLQKYYDEKYIQNNRQGLSSSENDFKQSYHSRLDSSFERNKNQLSQIQQNESQSQSSQKKINKKKKKNSEIGSDQKNQNFTDLQPWNEAEQDKTSLSFFHKTIYDPKNNFSQCNKSNNLSNQKSKYQ